MTVLQGEGVSGGVASGRLRFFRRNAQETPYRDAAGPEVELARYEAARDAAAAQLDKLYEDMKAALGEKKAFLFQVHRMMLEDQDFQDCITSAIREEGASAEEAIKRADAQFSQMFARMDDDYLRERAADVRDVSQRLLRILRGRQEASTGGEPCVVAAEDLTPSETAQLDRRVVLGFVTAKGAYNSHTAIFARTMGLPAVVGLGERLQAQREGELVFLDGTTGEVFINPDAATVARLEAERERQAALRCDLKALRDREAVAPDGRRVLVCANIGSIGDLQAVADAGADGIGLFRSEFLYLERDDYPTEEELYRAYRQVAEAMQGRTVVIRTLDIGADKQAAYFQLPPEENPAMGFRAIRICLARPDVFRTQLRALYRASAYGKIAIMFPMITSVSEVLGIKALCAQVRAELREEKTPFDEDVQLGIMVETPAAAVISDLLAREVDFFSIGTNDLTQFTLAVDRQNAPAQPYYDQRNEALLRLIRMTVESAHKAGIWVGVCGELAADPSMTGFFLDVGVDELSMAPHAICKIKAEILNG